VSVKWGNGYKMPVIVLVLVVAAIIDCPALTFGPFSVGSKIFKNLHIDKMVYLGVDR
jgi:hypothetical protein